MSLNKIGMFGLVIWNWGQVHVLFAIVFDWKIVFLFRRSLKPKFWLEINVYSKRHSYYFGIAWPQDGVLGINMSIDSCDDNAWIFGFCRPQLLLFPFFAMGVLQCIIHVRGAAFLHDIVYRKVFLLGVSWGTPKSSIFLFAIIRNDSIWRVQEEAIANFGASFLEMI